MGLHTAFSIYIAEGVFSNKYHLIRWWWSADIEHRASYLYRPQWAELTMLCRRVIPPGERVLLRTDAEPWLLNYYLYPDQLFQETTTPDIDLQIIKPSPRQRLFPRKPDIEVSWMIEDFAAGTARRQLLKRVPIRGN